MSAPATVAGPTPDPVDWEGHPGVPMSLFDLARFIAEDDWHRGVL